MSFPTKGQLVCLIGLLLLGSILAAGFQSDHPHVVAPPNKTPHVDARPPDKPPHNASTRTGSDDQGGPQPSRGSNDNPPQQPSRGSDEIPPQQPSASSDDLQPQPQPSTALFSWMDSVLLALGVVSLLLVGWFLKRFEKAAEAQQQAKISDLEKKVESAPDKVKPVWELAQFTLERYFQRNLKQVNAIYWLSIAVMIAGFLVLLWGIRIAVADPNRVKIALIASASGILTEFISLTFMVIYRSTMSQANEYVSVLERINTVGMAMQILDSMADGSSELKDQTRAQIITLLLSSSRAEMPMPVKALTAKQGE